MIVSTFMALALKGMGPNSTFWIVDMDSFNHINDDSTEFYGVHKYSGMQNI